MHQWNLPVMMSSQNRGQFDLLLTDGLNHGLRGHRVNDGRLLCVLVNYLIWKFNFIVINFGLVQSDFNTWQLPHFYKYDEY